jgi:hypothetical protein
MCALVDAGRERVSGLLRPIGWWGDRGIDVAQAARPRQPAGVIELSRHETSEV